MQPRAPGTRRGGVRPSPSSPGAWPERSHCRKHLPPHDLHRIEPVDTDDPAKNGLDAHPAQPLQLADELADLRSILTHIEKERGRLFDGVVIAPLFLAQPLQDIELAGDLRRRPDVARIAVSRDQGQRSSFATARDEDRWVRPAQALGQIEGAAYPDVLAFEGALTSPFAFPHLKAGAHGLLDDIEALAHR